MATPFFPRSVYFPPGNETTDQNPSGGHPPSFPQSPTFSAVAPPGIATNPGYPPGIATNPGYPPGIATNPGYPPQTQLPYPQGPYGNGDQMSAFGNYPGQQQPPSPGFLGVNDQKPGGSSPMPQPPYATVPDGNSGMYPPSPGFQLPSNTSGNIKSQDASAPPLSSLEKVPGYEHVTFDSAVLPPPVPSEWTEKPPDRKDMDYLHKFSKEEVEDAVLQYASEHCCYGESFPKKMEVTSVVMSSAYHYTIESFGEKRETAWVFEPYTGQYIDGPMNGPAPGPWEVEAKPKKYYVKSKIKKEVPHSACVKPCHGCAANGYVMCGRCVGTGNNKCHLCNGKGTRNEELCTTCRSTGQTRCHSCNGNGRKKCKLCAGHGKLKGFIELTVTWTNHVDDYISETDVMPKKKIRKVSGEVVFEEKMPRVWPINHCADQHVNKASKELVTKHGHGFKDELVLEQRHSLQIVPIGYCTYSWKDDTGDFCVYGFEQKVYFPDYPQKCCCCTIL